jgi:hypothetical protein
MFSAGLCDAIVEELLDAVFSANWCYGGWRGDGGGGGGGGSSSIGCSN